MHQVSIATGIDVIITGTTVQLIDTGFAVEVIIAITADHHVEGTGTGAGVNGVVAFPAIEEVFDISAVDHIVTVATVDMVGAGLAIENVIATLAVDRIVTVAGIQPVVVVGADQHFVRVVPHSRRAIGILALIRTIVADVGLRGMRFRIAQAHQQAVATNPADATGGIDAHVVGFDQRAVFVFALVRGGTGTGVGVAQFDVAVGVAKHITRQVPCVGGALDDVLELLGDHLLVEVGHRRQAEVEAEQVVETVTVHQPLHLILEDRIEGRAQLSGVDVFFRQTADPQIDGVVAVITGDMVTVRICRAGKEVGRLLCRHAATGVVSGQAGGVGIDDCLRVGDIAVKRIGGNEVHQ